MESWIHSQKLSAEANYQKNYKPIDYSSFSHNDDYTPHQPSSIQPFSPNKLKLTNFSGVDGKRSVLEDYDLGEMKYVGYLKNSKEPKGFIEIKGEIYTIFNGTPMGRNDGKVIQITPKKVVIRENIENFEGLWVSNDVEIKMIKED